MSDLLAPLTPPECDLRGYPFMPLLGDRLFNSDFDARATDAEFRAAMNLWWRAWTQVPAASLPDDDVVLCKLCGLGRDMRSWLEVKARALHGFELCADGRYYHRVLSELAEDAYDRRLKADSRRETDRNRLRAWREARREKGETPTVAVSPTVSKDVSTPDETAEVSRLMPELSVDDIPSDTPVKRVSSVVEETEKKREEKTPPFRPPLTFPTGLPAVASPQAAPPAEVRPSVGARLPDGWDPGEVGRAFAADLGLDADLILAQFGDYWRAKAGQAARKVDWLATWRVWCRNEAGTRGAKRAPQPRPGKLDWWIDEMRELGRLPDGEVPDEFRGATIDAEAVH